MHKDCDKKPTQTFLGTVVWVDECVVVALAAADEDGGVAVDELDRDLSGNWPVLRTLKMFKMSASDCRSIETCAAMKSLTEVLCHDAEIVVASEITLETSSLILAEMASVLVFSATHESWSKSSDIVSMRESS